MNYSVNQARLFYVMKGELQTSNAPTTTNTIQYVSTDVPYIVAQGAVDILRSDLLTNVESVRVSDGQALYTKLKNTTVTLTSNGGSVVAGQDYILRLEFCPFVGISDEEKYFKYGEVHATTGMSKATLYAEMVKSLKANFSKEVTKLVDISNAPVTLGGITFQGEGDLGKVQIAVSAADGNAATATLSSGVLTIKPKTGETGTTAITNINSAINTELGSNKPYSIKVVAVDSYDTASASDATGGILISEHNQAEYWRLGVKAATRVRFNTYTLPITVSGDEVAWGTVTSSDGNTVNNGKEIADLEYFCMGERGDIYRRMNWPHNIETTYLIDASKGYDVLDVHFSYVGSNESIQKSEKDMIIVMEHTNDLSKNNPGSGTGIVKLANEIAKSAGIKFGFVSKTGSFEMVTTA